MFGCIRAFSPRSVRAGLLLVCMLTTVACDAADGQGRGAQNDSGRGDSGTEDAGAADGSGDGGEPAQKESDEGQAATAEGDAGVVDLSEVLKHILPPIPISPIPPPRPPG